MNKQPIRDLGTQKQTNARKKNKREVEDLSPPTPYAQGLDAGLRHCRAGGQQYYFDVDAQVLTRSGIKVEEPDTLEYARGTIDGFLIENACNASPGIPSSMKPAVYRNVKAN